MYEQSYMRFLCLFFFLVCIFIPFKMRVQEIVHVFLIYFFLYHKVFCRIGSVE